MKNYFTAIVTVSFIAALMTGCGSMNSSHSESTKTGAVSPAQTAGMRAPVRTAATQTPVRTAATQTSAQVNTAAAPTPEPTNNYIYNTYTYDTTEDYIYVYDSDPEYVYTYDTTEDYIYVNDSDPGYEYTYDTEICYDYTYEPDEDFIYTCASDTEYNYTWDTDEDYTYTCASDTEYDYTWDTDEDFIYTCASDTEYDYIWDTDEDFIYTCASDTEYDYTWDTDEDFICTYDTDEDLVCTEAAPVSMEDTTETSDSESTEDRLISWAMAYFEKETGESAQYCECTAQSDGTYALELYNVVEDFDGTSRCASLAWYWVDEDGYGTDILGETVNIHP